MLTPEKIVADWLSVYDPETHTGLSPLILAERIRAYGDACAAAERERCGMVASQRAFDWREVLDSDPDSRMAHHRWCEACDIATAIRTAPPATPDPR